jgi:hypothetical protein
LFMANWRLYKCLGLALMLGLHCALVHATKPCPPPPCTRSTGQFDAAGCATRADWVAVGELVDVVRHPTGAPLNKDFAEFTLRVIAWEKAGQRTPAQIRFRIGWCENGQDLPSVTRGRFRFYGVALPADDSAAATFLHFEPVSEPR